MEEGIYLIIAAIAAVTIVAILLIMLKPEAPRMLRELTISAKLTRQFLFAKRKKRRKRRRKSSFQEYLLQSLLYGNSSSYGRIGYRLSKLRELYMALDRGGREQQGSIPQDQLERFGRKCIHEFLDMARKLTSKMVFAKAYALPVVDAKSILKHVATESIRNEEGKTGSTKPKVDEDLASTKGEEGEKLESAKMIESHFTTKPPTFEQIAEMARAVCQLIEYRNDARSKLLLFEEAVEEVSVLEDNLREYIDIMLNVGGENDNQQVRERYRSMGLREVKEIMAKRWELFSRLLGKKEITHRLLDRIIDTKIRLMSKEMIGDIELNERINDCKQLNAMIKKI